MNARRKLEREVEKLVEQVTSRGLLDKISIEHAKTALRMLKTMNLVELANLHMHLRHALDRGSPLTIRKT